MNTRIVGTDDVINMITKLSDGNPGAIVVCTEILKKTKEIDPDCVFEGIGTLLSLDMYNIWFENLDAI